MLCPEPPSRKAVYGRVAIAVGIGIRLAGCVELGTSESEHGEAGECGVRINYTAAPRRFQPPG